MTDTVVDFTAGVPVRGDLNVRWIHGSPPGRRVSEPKFQVHACDPHTYLLRQSKTVSFEAPFLYLLFGNERALLLDTGARKRPSASPLRATIDKLIAGWLHEHPRQGYQLVVAHTHGHNDHVAGDAQFNGRPATAVVGRGDDAILWAACRLVALEPGAVFTTKRSWPGDAARLDQDVPVFRPAGPMADITCCARPLLKSLNATRSGSTRSVKRTALRISSAPYMGMVTGTLRPGSAISPSPLARPGRQQVSGRSPQPNREVRPGSGWAGR